MNIYQQLPKPRALVGIFFRAVERRGDFIFKYSPNESLLLDSRKKIGKINCVSLQKL